MRALLHGGLLALGLTLAGCAGSWGSPERNPRASTTPSPSFAALVASPSDFDAEPREVPAALAEADLDFALDVFADAYAAPEGHAPLPPRARIDETRRVIRSRATWSPFEFATLLRDLLRADDGHLAFGYGGERPLRLDALPAPPAPPVIAAPPVELVEGEVPVLVVRTFETAAAEALATLPRLAERLRVAPAFVVDLRGNRGGNYTFAERFLRALAHGPIHALGTREVQSVTAALGRVNAAKRRLARGDVPPAARGMFLEHITRLEGLAADLAARGEGRIEIVRKGEILQGTAPAPLVGRGVVLVDRGCASACEMFVALARQIPGLLVAGERTRGSMAVGEVASFVLPRSRLVVTLGTRAIVDPLGDFDETRGFVPDLDLAGPGTLIEARHVASFAPASAWAAAKAGTKKPR
ncbi:S41 family peptidase [Polyangium mundeleinium]|uniref:S41 family peptidase n=1 Tax=Polyangium mundeleinium TaxID=2995306 RepID=A0ABT5F0N4_9BACT|nr:S41 family peptidase [Polyangium mundeleinium]MDC0747638.1 S41 family peptidase [Polyangium mundeleinium]